MTNSYDILHFSYRKMSSFREEGCYMINLVFRVWDPSEYSYVKQRFLDESDEWISRRVTKDKELADRYSQGLRMVNADTGKDLLEDWKHYKKECEENDIEPDMNESFPVSFVNDYGIEEEDVYFTAYEKNWNNMLEYKKKFDVFRFYEYFEINPITEGIIQHIENLKVRDDRDEYYAEQLLRSLKALEYFWD
jgi:hypothetical protein